MKKKGSMRYPAASKAGNAKSFKFKSKSNLKSSKKIRTGEIVLSTNRKNKKGINGPMGRLNDKQIKNSSTGDDFEQQLSELKARENSRYLSSRPKPKFRPVLLPSVFETVKADLARQAHSNTLDEIDNLYMENQNEALSSDPKQNNYDNKTARVIQYNRRNVPEPTVSRRNMFSVFSEEDSDEEGEEDVKKPIFELKPSILSGSQEVNCIDDYDI